MRLTKRLTGRLSGSILLAPLSMAPFWAVMLLAGCARPVSAPALPLNADSAGAPRLSSLIEPRITSHPATVINTPRTGAPLQSLGVATPIPGAAAGQASGPGSSASGSVSLNFTDADIRAVVAQILGKIMQVSYTIDPSVTGKATLHTARPVPMSQLLPILQALLAQNHAELTASDGIYRVVPLAAGAGTSGLAGGAGLGGAMVVPLHYVNATQLAQVLQPYVGKEGRVVASPGGNALLIDGNGATRATLAALVEAFDTDALAGQSYALLPAKGEGVKEMAAALSASFTRGKAASRLKVIPLDRIQAVMVIAPSPGELEQAERAYGVLSAQAMRTRRIWHVYYLRNSSAGEVAHVLQEAFTPNDVTAEPPSQTQGQASGMAGGGFGASGFGASGGMNGGAPGGYGGTSGGFGGGGGGGLLGNSGLIGGAAQSTGDPSLQSAAAGQPASAGAATSGASGASANPLLGPLGGGASGEGGTPTGTRIIPDAQRNAVLVYATEDKDATIRSMMRALDIEPMEVEIDATIAEVDLDAALQYGTQFFFKSGGINAVLSQGTTSSLVKNFPGFVLSGYGADAAPLAISALQSVTKVKVLSSPQLLVQNNHTANLLVGNLVPYLSQTSQSTLTSGAPVINSINYQETGVILQITPRISDDGLVTLQVSQQVSAVSPTITTQGLNSPTFSERAVSSSVVVHNGQTIGLAGLITDTDQRANSGLPFLKDVPLLGSLFSNQNNSRQRTELLVLITPHVVRDETDATSLTEDLRQALPAASNVPRSLAAEPFDGAADPNARINRRIGLH